MTDSAIMRAIGYASGLLSAGLLWWAWIESGADSDVLALISIGFIFAFFWGSFTGLADSLTHRGR